MAFGIPKITTTDHCRMAFDIPKSTTTGGSGLRTTAQNVWVCYDEPVHAVEDEDNGADGPRGETRCQALV